MQDVGRPRGAAQIGLVSAVQDPRGDGKARAGWSWGLRVPRPSSLAVGHRWVQAL